MSDTTTRGDGVIIDRGTAGTGTLPRPGRTRPEREAARTPRPRAPRPARADQSRTAPVPPQARRTQSGPKRPQPGTVGAVKVTAKSPQAKPRPKRIRTAAPQAAPAPKTTAPKTTAPKTTAPKTAAPQTAGAAAAARLRGVSPAATNRMPFIVLLCGLLGGALASALVISTTLAEGSFEISKLQQSDSSLARQRQQLQDQVSQAQSAPVIQQRAYELGMRPAGQLQFLNLKTGKVENAGGPAGSASAAGSAAHEAGPGAAVQNP